jgi:hypothetical protein
MSIISIPERDAGAFAKSVLHHLLQHGDIAGRDTAGRTLLQVAVDDWPLDELCAFDAAAEDLEDSDEPEPEDIDGAPIDLEVVRSRRIRAATRCLNPHLQRSGAARRSREGAWGESRLSVKYFTFSRPIPER